VCILKVGERVTGPACGLLEGHAAKVAAKRAALVRFQVAPFPDPGIFGHGVLVVTNDLEGVALLADIAIDPGALQDRERVGGLQIALLAPKMALGEAGRAAACAKKSKI
jgi:hypothetical protein